MNAYLFSAGYTASQFRPTPSRTHGTAMQAQTWDGCSSAIIYGGDVDRAQKKFVVWMTPAPDAENPAETQIKKIVAAQLVDQLLTESANQPLDWRELTRQMTDSLENIPADDFEQGYWVDINQTLPPGKISFDLDSLKRDVPEEIRSGLNWSPDKQFYFLVSVLSPGTMPAIPADEPETPDADTRSAGDEAGESTGPGLDGSVTALPEMRDKETAALVKARNSVVAAWLWRKFAADTRVAANEIYISPCCTLIPVE